MRGRLLPALLLALAAAGGALGLSRWWLPGKVLGQVEETTLEWRLRSVPPRPPAQSPVVLVLFDSASVAEWPYLSPFPRAVLADLVTAIARARPRAIGVDVFLDRRYPALDALDHGDARLRQAIARAGNVVLPGMTEETGHGRVFLPPDSFFARAAAGTGAADTPTPYETVRDGVLAVDAGGSLVPGFATALWAQATAADLPRLLASARRQGRLPLPGLPARDAALPRSGEAQSVPLLFLGRPSRAGSEGGAFPAFSASTLLQLGELVPPEWFRGRVVLLGSGFHGEERFRTPFYSARMRGTEDRVSGWTYGVELHATLLEQLLTRRYLHLLPGWLAGVAALGLALLVCTLTLLRGVGWGATATAALFLGSSATSFWLFGSHAVQAPMVMPAVALALAFVGTTSYRVVREGRDKRLIRGAFDRYLSPAVVEELISDPGRLRLSGEKREVTVMFTDLEGFTAISEDRDPAELVAMLNQYLDEMASLVIAEGGLLDKYLGDGLMALFGAPKAQPDHALRACRCALAMQRRLGELNDAWTRAGWPALRMRVGINTGKPVVGNIGGRHRFDYTALGDAVNLASRLEEACKVYGVGILMSASTRGAAGGELTAREVEVLAVYGRAEPLAVFELLEPGAGAADPGRLRSFEAGIRAFRGRDFELARVYFQAGCEAAPGDGPAALYLARCEQLIAAPPPEDWSFVERRRSK